MDNAAVARAIAELADLMELEETETFKVRAFRNASRAIEGLGEKVTDLATKGTLKKVKGLGDGVIRRITELLSTGKIAEVEERRAKLPPGLFELMNVPGIGIKTAQQVWRERGVTTIDQLEAAAKEGKLRDLPRFGEKKEEKLLASIAAYRKRASQPKRRLLSEALSIGEMLLAFVNELPGVKAAELGGSLRRSAETVGDLDVLVAADAKDAPAILEAFATSKLAVELLGKGDTKASIVLDGGCQADLRVVPPASWGAAIQYFTGSKDHNVAMRTIAVKKGLKVSEYGVFDAEGKKIAGETEQSVYEAIGLTWMPPEMRENRGEIEASQKKKLPNLIEERDLKGDMHMHTVESDGKATLEDMVEAQRESGRTYCAITEHSGSLAIARGLDAARLAAHVKRIRALADKTGFDVFAGLETDILADGSLDLADSLDGLDWVVGSVHSKLNMPREEQTKRVVRAIESGKIDCLGHATGRQIGVRDGADLDMEAVLQALARVGAAIELNSSPLRLDVDEHTARMARDLGVPVVINSDAHSVRELGFLRYGVGIARRAWLGKEHVLNTFPAEKIRERRASRLRH